MSEKRVLIVEDDDTVRRLLIEYLRDVSCLQVDGARDGVDALHEISARSYAVVVLDVMMPHMSGVDFLTSLDALMSDPSFPSLEQSPAIVVVTSASPEELPSDGLQRRFRRFVRAVLRKPVDVAALAEQVKSLIVTSVTA